jgi:hypothetical protein
MSLPDDQRKAMHAKGKTGGKTAKKESPVSHAAPLVMWSEVLDALRLGMGKQARKINGGILTNALRSVLLKTPKQELRGKADTVALRLQRALREGGVEPLTALVASASIVLQVREHDFVTVVSQLLREGHESNHRESFRTGYTTALEAMWSAFENGQRLETGLTLHRERSQESSLAQDEPDSYFAGAKQAFETLSKTYGGAA